MNKTSRNIWTNRFYELTPKDCLNLKFEQSFAMLKNILGDKKIQNVFCIKTHYPSPIHKNINNNWAKSAKIIGVNPRITKTYWGIVKYAMTFPENAIHIMPLWETGDGSLYVQNSWDLNPEFLDTDLVNLGFKTCEDQLKLTINILHALGKIVGFDTLPHVDNFSEIVILNPRLFEWIKLNNEKTAQLFDVDYNLIYKEIENILISHLRAPENLFELKEDIRKEIMFPAGVDKFQQRMKLRKIIRDNGYEPLPVVEHAPMRPILFDKIHKSDNENWAEFKVEHKAQNAKILGSVTPYKWYKIDENGYPIKNAIENNTWNYFINKIYEFQNKYNFDFLRADMAHNQISHSHNGIHNNEVLKEIWAELKTKIQSQKPYFSTFAEAFYNTYYIDGLKDMQNKNFDIVLGNMNFRHINEDYFNWIYDFLNPFKENFSFNPSVTIFTNDGDLSCHDKLFASNDDNKIRYFISLFLNLPSYMGMGYETRNINKKMLQEYSKAYVKKQHADFCFGDNTELFQFISKMRNFYIKYKTVIEEYELNLIDTEDKSTLSWSYIKNNEIRLLFIVKTNKKTDLEISEEFELKYSNENCFIYELL